MNSNFLRSVYGITSFGESHGKAIGVIIEDIKPGIVFPLSAINKALAKRKPGRSPFSSARQEEDRIEVISGLIDGKTTGMPICLLVYNRDHRSHTYEAIKDIFRPEHADLAYFSKYKIYDYRGGGRASGRETIARVAAAAIIDSVIDYPQIDIYPLSIGIVRAKQTDLKFARNNDLNWPCRETYSDLLAYLTSIKNAKDSVGGIVQVKIDNIKPGIGDPVYQKLDAKLAEAIISIGGVKGIEFGSGFDLARLKGSEANQTIESIKPDKKETNAGGIWGGIATGSTVSFRFSVKPTPSIGIEQTSVDKSNNARKIQLEGRFDTCIIPRIIPVAEAMIKLALADAISYQKLIEEEELGLQQLREAIDKIDEDLLISLYRRKKIVEIVKKWKQTHNEQDYQPQREKELLESLQNKAQEFGLSQIMVAKVWRSIFENNRGKV